MADRPVLEGQGETIPYREAEESALVEEIQYISGKELAALFGNAALFPTTTKFFHMQQAEARKGETDTSSRSTSAAADAAKPPADKPPVAPADKDVVDRATSGSVSHRLGNMASKDTDAD